jgi:hypothetical protein
MAIHYQKDKKLIERIRSKFIRIVTGYSELDFHDRQRRLNLLTLDKQSNCADLIELYGIFRQQSAIRLCGMFQPALEIRIQGHALKLQKIRSSRSWEVLFLNTSLIAEYLSEQDGLCPGHKVSSMHKVASRLPGAGHQIIPIH